MGLSTIPFRGNICYNNTSQNSEYATNKCGKIFYIEGKISGIFQDKQLLKYIWSPWRMEYIQNFRKEEGCIFCKEISLSDGPGNLIVHRGRYNCVILNRFPYTSGHIMILPYIHCSNLEELDSETRSELMELTNQAVGLLQAEYKAEGFNIGINIGEAAGAGIAEHLHLHIVPRWEGDTNFMSTLGETRVLPEMLEESYTRISEAWKGVKPAKDI